MFERHHAARHRIFDLRELLLESELVGLRPRLRFRQDRVPRAVVDVVLDRAGDLQDVLGIVFVARDDLDRADEPRASVEDDDLVVLEAVVHVDGTVDAAIVGALAHRKLPLFQVEPELDPDRLRRILVAGSRESFRREIDVFQLRPLFRRRLRDQEIGELVVALLVLDELTVDERDLPPGSADELPHAALRRPKARGPVRQAPINPDPPRLPGLPLDELVVFRQREDVTILREVLEVGAGDRLQISVQSFRAQRRRELHQLVNVVRILFELRGVVHDG